jgi:hypothetical protein
MVQTQRASDTAKAKEATAPVRKKAGFAPLTSLFDRFELADKGGYITQEFQDFGYRLACELEDMSHKSLYIKMSKTIERGILERALSFVSDAGTAKSKARLFMWKVKELQKSKQENEKNL